MTYLNSAYHLFRAIQNLHVDLVHPVVQEVLDFLLVQVVLKVQHLHVDQVLLVVLVLLLHPFVQLNLVDLPLLSVLLVQVVLPVLLKKFNKKE